MTRSGDDVQRSQRDAAERDADARWIDREMARGRTYLEARSRLEADPDRTEG